MHYEPWMLAAIDQAGYNGITDEHIATVAREIRLTGLTEISRQDFESACRRCGAMNEVENTYCKSCGAPLKIPAPGSQGPAASSAGGQAGYPAPSGNAASAQAGAAAQQQAG